MRRIHVHTPFLLTLDDGSMRAFRAGEHVIDERTAEHWYVQAHSEPLSSPATSEAPDAPAVSAAPARKSKSK